MLKKECVKRMLKKVRRGQGGSEPGPERFISVLQHKKSHATGWKMVTTWMWLGKARQILSASLFFLKNMKKFL